MQTVWKYQLDQVRTVIPMPADAQFLCVQVEHADIDSPEGNVLVPGWSLCMWFSVSTDAPLRNRTFQMFGTGVPISTEPLTYLGSGHFLNGQLVLHVFEEKEN